MSTMYSLLNFIAVTSRELTGQGTAPRGEKAKVETGDGIDIVFGTFTDDEKRTLGISTICVVTHLALEIKKEEVCWMRCYSIF
jgi:phosphatidylinositol 4-kinase